uniref:class I SAM-dependent methyltransferase n=1 Tax=Alistipes sp. TaxID=1872444 RepID=UPI004056B0CA
MKRVITAERVSRDLSDNYVFQRSLLAYHEAAQRVEGKVLEIGTGSGYGVEVIAPHTTQFITLDKHRTQGLHLPSHAEFREAKVPPLPFPDEEFDTVISFQVIEHIKQDQAFVKEVARVLKPGGSFIVSTPNRPMSLTRNPWHIREYSGEEFYRLLAKEFSEVEKMGVEGNARIMAYYEKNREGVERITRFDPLRLQWRLPRWMLKLPYDLLNRLNRRRLLSENDTLTRSIRMEDYRLVPLHEGCFDLFFIAHKAK